MSIDNCSLIKLRGMQDIRGNLTFIEGEKDFPFAIKRVYYLYDVPDNFERGAHAHKNLEQLIIAVTGSFDLLIDDGLNKKQIRMDSPNQGLYVCPMIWRVLSNFSSDAVCMVLASNYYDESDYIRHYQDFIGALRGN